MNNGAPQVYAPSPQPPAYAPHFDYSVPNEPAYPPLRPTNSSPNPTAPPGYQKEVHIGVDYRDVVRTPSPTPSENEALSKKMRSCAPDIKRYLNKEWLSQPRNIIQLVVFVVVIGLLITFVVMQQKIVEALGPQIEWLRETPGAWAIPIGIMIILSFPPLIGHELVAIICGDVWGVGIGFAIVAAGTIIGELVTYCTFRFCCRGRGQKMEEKNLQYALLSEVIRDGGLKMAIMIRFSAIPSHLTTAIFATAGMGIVTFFIAAFVALPKQLAAVYLGVSENSGAPVDENGEKKVTKTTTIIKVVVITITVIMTLVAMRYVDNKIDVVKGRVIYARRKARQAKLKATSDAVPSAPSYGVTPFGTNPHSGSVTLPDLDLEEATTPLRPTRGTESDDVPLGAMAPTPPGAAHHSSYYAHGRYDSIYGGSQLDVSATSSSQRLAP